MGLELLTQIFEVCVIPLLGVLTGFLIKWISAKISEISTNTNNVTYQKYLEMLDNTITACVITTNQTYVTSLKNQNAFTVEAQKEAFTKTYEAVLALLTEEAQTYLSEAIGDLQLYITQKIEAEVNINKA